VRLTQFLVGFLSRQLIPYRGHWQREDMLDELKAFMPTVSDPFPALEICLVDRCAAMHVSTDGSKCSAA